MRSRRLLCWHDYRAQCRDERGVGGFNLATSTDLGVNTRQAVGCSGVDKTAEVGVDTVREVGG